MLTLKNCSLIGYFCPVDEFLRGFGTNFFYKKPIDLPLFLICNNFTKCPGKR
jgi:hypothetical protein